MIPNVLLSIQRGLRELACQGTICKAPGGRGCGADYSSKQFVVEESLRPQSKVAGVSMSNEKMRVTDDELKHQVIGQTMLEVHNILACDRNCTHGCKASHISCNCVMYSCCCSFHLHSMQISGWLSHYFRGRGSP